MGKVRQTLKRYWPIYAIVICSIIPLSWFKGRYYLAGGDEMSYLNPGISFASFLYTWLDKFNLGQPNLSLYSVFPYKLFWYLLQHLSLPNLFIEKLWIMLIFILPGISMYLMVSYMLRSFSKPKANLASFGASLFYLFNVFSMLNPIQSNTRLVLFALPLILLFWIKALNQDKVNLKYPIYIGLTSVLITSANSNLALVALIPACMILYSLYLLVFGKVKIKLLLVYCVSTVLIYIILNIWWISGIYFTQQGSGQDVVGLLRGSGYLDATPFWEAFRLMGYWAFREAYNGQAFFSYANSYYQYPLLLSTYTLVAISLIPLILRKKQKPVIFFSLLFILGLFFSKGTNPPFGGLFGLLLEKLPIFWIFRNPYSKFIPLCLFSSAALIGYLIADLLSFTGNKKVAIIKYGLTVVTISIILYSAKPFFSNKIYNPEKLLTPTSIQAQLPGYWQDAISWFKQNDSDARVLLMPKSAYGMSFIWPSGITGATNVANHLLSNQIISYNHTSKNGTDLAINSLYDAIVNNDEKDVSRLLNLFNIKYILHQGDISETAGLYIKGYSYQKLKDLLSLKKGIRITQSFGRLDIYENVNYLNNQIRIDNFHSLSFDNVTSYERLVNRKSDSNDGLIIPLSGKLPAGNQNLLSLSTPKNIYPLGFVGIKPCSLCRGEVGITFRYLLKELNNEVRSLFLTQGAVEVLKETELTNGVYVLVTYPYESSLSIPLLQWDYVQDLDIGYAYETYLPDNFPDYLVSTANMTRLFYVLHDNRLMTMKILDESLTRIDEVIVGSVAPKRIAVGTKEKKITGDYQIVYLESVPKDPYIERDFNEVTKVTSLPEISYTKINPTKYTVDIKSAKEPYFLTLSESYNSQWQIEIKNGRSLKRLPENFHLASLGYINSWYIDQLGDYQVILSHKSQIYLSFAYSIATFSLLASFLYLLLYKRRVNDTRPGGDNRENYSLKGWQLLAAKAIYYSLIVCFGIVIIFIGNNNELEAGKYGSLCFAYLLLMIVFNMLALITSKDDNK